jgi:predicted O-methyltransferase YrrM
MADQELPAITLQALSSSLKAQTQILRPNKRLDDAVEHAKKNGIPPIAVGPAQGQFLALLCRMSNAHSVLEVGTLGGYSTIWFAESIPGIQVTSIEYNPKHRDVAVENTKDLPNVDVRLGAAIEIMPKLGEEGKVFDFVFIDANWDMQAQYFDEAVKLTRKGGSIYVDNVVRNLLDDPPEDKADWSLIEHLQNDDRVVATLIPTLATHKVKTDELVDGFVLAIVK